jgi:hypothetical protein
VVVGAAGCEAVLDGAGGAEAVVEGEAACEAVLDGAAGDAATAGTDGFGAGAGSRLTAAFAVVGAPEVSTALARAASTSTTEIAITARSPSGPPGNLGRRRPSASETISAHATSTPPAT